METTKAQPANQKRRINILQFIVVVLLPLTFLTRPGLPISGLFMDIIENLGILLVIAGVMGRLWAILYIGSRKNAMVMQDGPYSICRHPLYLFSTLSVLGFGLMIGSLILALVMTAITLYVLNDIAKKEEVFLRSEFGDTYDAYSKITPRIFPKLALFTTQQNVTFNVSTLRRNFIDALAFLALIPLGEMTEYFKDMQSWPTFPLY